MTTEIIEWQRIRSEIAQVSSIEVMSKLNYSLEAIQKWAKQSKQSLEIQNDIAEYRLRINRKQGVWIEANIPEEGWSNLPNENGRQQRPTLAEAGIDYHDSPKFRLLAKIPEARFWAIIEDIKSQGELTTNEVCHAFNKNIASKWTGEQENYTPSLYIEAARSVMGSIDCDPASSVIAQKTVRAGRYWTKEQNGLKQNWSGNVFLNPPYSHPDVGLFIDKLLTELNKQVRQAILLTNNNTDTAFFHKAAKVAKALCFTKGRIQFLRGNGVTSPTNGQVFYYFGDRTNNFTDIFSSFGLIMVAL